MKGRIFSTLLLWAILALTAYFFRTPGAVCLTAIAALVTQYELYGMLSKLGKRPLVLLGCGVGLFVSLCPLLFGDSTRCGPGLVAPSLLLFSIVALLRKPRGNVVETIGSTLIGLILAPCTLVYVSLIIVHYGPSGKGLMMALWLVMTTKFTDMGALLTGLAIGKHKMAPTLSPKKTWEGAVGGIVLCVLCSALYVHFCAEWLPEGFTWLTAGLISLPIAGASIFADLLESAFKRECGIKDSGNMLPGIGGIFDLTDSFMLSAPLAYYVTVFILG